MLTYWSSYWPDFSFNIELQPFFNVESLIMYLPASVWCTYAGTVLWLLGMIFEVVCPAGVTRIGIWANLLKWFRSYGGIHLGVCFTQIFRAFSTKLRFMWIHFSGARMIQTSIIIPSLVGLLLHPPLGGGRKSLMFFLSVTLLNDKVCELDFAIKALECGNDLRVIGKGNACSCAPAFNLVSAMLCRATAEWWSCKLGKKNFCFLSVTE